MEQDPKRAWKIIAVPVLCIALLMVSIRETGAEGFWDAFFQLGYDPVMENVDQSLAYERIEMLLEFRDRVSQQLEVDQEVVASINGLRSLDVGALYAVLPYSDSGSVWYANGVRGGWDSGKYRLRMSDPRIQEWVHTPFALRTETWGRQKYFGDLGLGN